MTAPPAPPGTGPGARLWAWLGRDRGIPPAASALTAALALVAAALAAATVATTSGDPVVVVAVVLPALLGAPLAWPRKGDGPALGLVTGLLAGLALSAFPVIEGGLAALPVRPWFLVVAFGAFGAAVDGRRPAGVRRVLMAGVIAVATAAILGGSAATAVGAVAWFVALAATLWSLADDMARPAPPVARSLVTAANPATRSPLRDLAPSLTVALLVGALLAVPALLAIRAAPSTVERAVADTGPGGSGAAGQAGAGSAGLSGDPGDLGASGGGAGGAASGSVGNGGGAGAPAGGAGSPADGRVSPGGSPGGQGARPGEATGGGALGTGGRSDRGDPRSGGNGGNGGMTADGPAGNGGMTADGSGALPGAGDAGDRLDGLDGGSADTGPRGDPGRAGPPDDPAVAGAGPPADAGSRLPLIAGLALLLLAAVAVALALLTRPKPPEAETLGPAWARERLRRLEREGTRRGRRRGRAESVIAYADGLAAGPLPDARIAELGRTLSTALFGPVPPPPDAPDRTAAVLDDVCAAHPRPRRLGLRQRWSPAPAGATP